MASLTQLRVAGAIRPPGDKSISHRALILSALARGTSRISHVLESDDVRSTASALRALGVAVPSLAPEMAIAGVSRKDLRSPPSGAPLQCGNSGTTARLLAGVVAGCGLTATFEGDASLSRRPMQRVAEPLRAMGAQVLLSPANTLPMTVRGAPLHAIDWTTPVASAQVKSAILLAAVLAGAPARVTEPQHSRDHTERMLQARGVGLTRENTTAGVSANQLIQALDVSVPADPSSAAFFVALALLADSGELRITDVCLNPSRAGFLEILRGMGASIEIEDERESGGEPVGTIVARPSSLRGATVGAADVPATIDELPVLACLATCARGETTVSGAAELRVKESDRIAAIVGNLRAVGAEAEERPDGFTVRGSDRPLRGAVRTAGDHRIAMAFGVLAALPGNAIAIDDRACASVSYPAFWRDMERALS